MHNSTCQHSSPLFYMLTLWNCGGPSPPYLLKKDYLMEKYKDKIEVIFLITIFISSLSAITPIS